MPELIHTLRLPVPVDRAWAALDDPDLVASLFPGAEVEARGSDDVAGDLSVRVGPVRARYTGHVRVTWRDRPARRFVLEASGEEADGLGSLQATIHVTLTAAEGGTASDLELRTNLAITGRVAQFGDAVLDDVLGRHLQGLVAGLEAAGFPEAPLRPEPVGIDLEHPPLGSFPDPEPSDPEPELEPHFSEVELPLALEPDPAVTPPATRVPLPPPPPPPSPPAPPVAAPAPPPPSPVAPPPPAAPVAPAPPVSRPDRSVARVALRPPAKPRHATPAPGGPTRPPPEIVAIPPVTAPAPPPPPPPPPPAPPAPSPAPAAVPPPPDPAPPAARPAPAPAPERAMSPAAAAEAEDASLAAKAAPYAVVLLLLWILRRMFGSDDR